jgi:hypothetical protein
MNFERAMYECRKAGGGRIQDSQCNTWRVNIEGDPIKICGCDCVAGHDWKCLPDNPAPQPAPQPELMTMAKAIAKAVEMGGGEVWLDDTKKVTIYKNMDMEPHILFEPNKKFMMSYYTVRPLPPETFHLTEAMARLMRGESVEYTHHGRSYCIVPRITVYCESAGSSITVEFSELKGMTFRAVVK